MHTRDLVENLAVASVAGCLATRVMEPVRATLYRLESPQDRAREDAARPGPPYQIAADKTLHLLGVRLPDPVRQRAGMAAHYGLAIGWAPSTRCCAVPPGPTRCWPGWQPVGPCR
jgi:hypothetical protein